MQILQTDNTENSTKIHQILHTFWLILSCIDQYTPLVTHDCPIAFPSVIKLNEETQLLRLKYSCCLTSDSWKDLANIQMFG